MLRERGGKQARFGPVYRRLPVFSSYGLIFTLDSKLVLEKTGPSLSDQSWDYRQ